MWEKWIKTKWSDIKSVKMKDEYIEVVTGDGEFDEDDKESVHQRCFVPCHEWQRSLPSWRLQFRFTSSSGIQDDPDPNKS